VARNVSTWVRTSATTEALCRDAVEAIATAMGPPGNVATLILPADVSWSEGAQIAPPLPPKAAPVASEETLRKVATALREGGKTAILLGVRACRSRA